MPSFAADLCAMGDGARIVGVSQYSKSASCAAQAPEVANFASVNAERIVALHPDAIVAIPAQRRLIAPLERAGIRSVLLADESYNDIFRDIDRLGAIAGDSAGASRLSARLRERTKALQATERGNRRPRVFVVLQAQPIWTVGPQSFISTLLQLAGARNAVTDLPRPYAQYTAEALIRLQPDAIVAGGDTQLESLLGREPWRSLRAVHEHHVYMLADPSTLERPGPNYNEGLSWLIERLRPLTQ
jgi:iron complex transport system substrate-binding protein